MINVKHLAGAVLILCTTMSSGPAVSGEYWDPEDYKKYMELLKREDLKEQKRQEIVRNKETPAVIEEMKKKYIISPGPYHLYKGDGLRKYSQIITDETNKRIKKYFPFMGYATINDNGDWFICTVVDQTYNGVPYYRQMIMSNHNWILFSSDVSGEFFESISNKACKHDDEVVE
ncbi:Hypothetical protein GbCGDNIH6_7135 [Granulibacter bethesdensis]|uniref:hypothetical protein n=1 Tax=Granulibacter bethesdensis TaxID=364410 RepID=UPI000909F09B|nr:hypothetical protein [Granulibacter bethesdensis]APH57385.1 Hypothetical protein GbCGDNIH6_7135 [Granulibacter bethesdensis]